jgi:nucleoside-diphosphate kinase
LERTFTIIKPDAVEAGYSGAIITAIESAGFRLMAMKKRIMRRQEAEVFYAVHRDKAFFSDLMAYITRSPVIVMALEKENAVADFRTLIGATDPAKADPVQSGSDLPRPSLKMPFMVRIVRKMAALKLRSFLPSMS